MNRVLITGATGFIGSHLAEALVQHGDSVKCLVRSKSKCRQLAGLDVQLVEGDVTAAESVAAAVKGVDCVYHVAGAVRAVTGQAMWRANAVGTKTVVDACAAADSPPTFLFVSSLAAAGPSPADRPHRESDPCRPVSNYGRSKRAGEVAAAKVADCMPITIVRPPIVFGPRDRSTLMLFRPVKRFGVLAVPSSFQNQYSFLHSDDLVDAMIAAAKYGKRLAAGNDGAEGFEQGCYFVAYDPPVTYCQFGELVAKSLGRRKFRRVRVSDSIIKMGGRISDVAARIRRKAPLFSYDKAREATAGHWVCSPRLIEAECGYRPAASLALRVEQTARWLFEHGWLRAPRNRAKGISGGADYGMSSLQSISDSPATPSYPRERETTQVQERSWP